jgi:peptidoglycan/LPS O-acetylase OafA/YrhL
LPDALSARDARIDALRGLAILLVLVLHFSISYGLHKSPLANWLPPMLLDAVLWNGNYGVTLFFTLSGFLIAGPLLAKPGALAQLTLGDFYLRRFARILPPLLLALALIIALGYSGHPSFANVDGGHNLPASFSWWAAFSVLSFWHNVLMQQLGYFNYALNVYWSLSVEEVFYLCLPLACLLLRRRRWLLLACAALIAIGPWYRAQHLESELYFMYGYWACFDAIALGVAAAILAPHIRLSGTARVLLQWLAGALLLFSFLMGIGGHEVFGFSQVALACAALLVLKPVAAQPGICLASWPGRALRWLGRHSYELYLFHCIVLGLLREALPRSAVAPEAKLGLLLAFLLASCLLAALVARHIGTPANRYLRRRLARRPNLEPAFIRI